MPYSEQLYEIQRSIGALANAIYPSGVAGAKDATGSHVGSMVEAAMGQTEGLVCISRSLDDVAESIRDLASAVGDIATAITEK